MYMAVSMVINILTTVPLVPLIILNVLLVFPIAFLSPAEGRISPRRSSNLECKEGLLRGGTTGHC